MGRSGKRVGLYGGGFDPPHIGHQFACLYLLQCRSIDQVVLIPAWRHPLGKKAATYEIRLHMCQLLAAPFGDTVQVSDVERQLDSDGRTLKVLQHLIAADPQVQLSLAVGADNMEIREKWYKWEEIERLVPIHVIGRRGYASRQRTVELPNISSHDIRARVAANEPIDHLVPSSIRAVIQKEELYR